MAEAEDESPWLTLREAAERTGKQLDAMRALARRGRLQRRKGNRGEWLVKLPHTMAQAVQGTALGSDLDTALDDAMDTELAGLRGQVTELRVALACAEGRLEVARVEAAARIEAFDMAGRLHAAELAARETAIVRLEAELARLRLPFWRRWGRG